MGFQRSHGMRKNPAKNSRMPELVINTGPLIALCAALDDLTVLKTCYSCIHIPSAVATELTAGHHGDSDLKRLDETGIFEIASMDVSPSLYLCSRLDRGEAAVIESALSFGISKVAIDERIGRRVARMHGLSVTGSTGMLVKCARSGAIPNLETCFDSMASKGIWISKAIQQEALKEVKP